MTFDDPMSEDDLRRKIQELQGQINAYEHAAQENLKSLEDKRADIRDLQEDLEEERKEYAAAKAVFSREARTIAEAAVATVLGLQPAAPTQPSRPKSYIPLPSPFLGQGYRDFKRAIDVYLHANRAEITKDEDKIYTVLNLMQGDLAAGWATNYIEERRVRGIISIQDTWEEFSGFLEKSFGDSYEEAHAIDRLSKIRQGARTAEEFFREVDVLRRQAQYTTPEFEKTMIRRLELAVNQHVLNKVLSMPNIPKTYEEWKKHAITFDEAHRHYEEVMKERQPARPATPFARRADTPPPNRRAPPPPPPPRNDRRDATGTTFGGIGQPMDVSIDRARRNGQCFGCGKTGHLVANCPDKKTVIRVLSRALGAEGAMDLVNEIRRMRESEFDDTEEVREVIGDISDSHTDNVDSVYPTDFM